MAVPSDPEWGVYVTEHDPATSVQVVELNVPEPLELNVTVPPGVIGVPPVVSLTVAVQVDAIVTSSGSGEQLTAVPLDRLSTVRLVVLELVR